MHGIEWKSFDDDKVAAAVADEYIARNRDMFPWVEEKFPPIVSKVSPLLASQFYYIYSEGMKHHNEIQMQQQLEMEGDLTKAGGSSSAAALEWGGDLMASLSGGAGGGGAGGGEDGPDEQTIWNENELKVVERALANLKNTNLFKLMSMIKLMSMALHMNSHIGCVYDLNSIG